MDPASTIMPPEKKKEEENRIMHSPSAPPPILETDDFPPDPDPAGPRDDRVRTDEIHHHHAPNASRTSPSTSNSITPVLPPELMEVDFSHGVAWGKYSPYKPHSPLPTVPLDTPPDFTFSPALCFQIHQIHHRGRAGTLHLRPRPGQQQPLVSSSLSSSAPTAAGRPIPTPMFMPVGTKGSIKGVSWFELLSDPALSCPILLGNTYHLALQPGTDLLDEMGGLHTLQGVTAHVRHWQQEEKKAITARSAPAASCGYNLLTDSGGFQMVSLVQLSQVTEEGVTFENPFSLAAATDHHHDDQDDDPRQDDDDDPTDPPAPKRPKKIVAKKDLMLLRPEDSMHHQHKIGANIIMALDDVVSSVAENEERFTEATLRTLRWYDRCYQAHVQARQDDQQNLFPITQGGLDIRPGGLREICLAGLRHRQQQTGYRIPGFAVGGLAGGESKDAFWRVVDHACRSLPDMQPRYLMGVGYPLDVVICSALGVDLFDCVYPTRTARFGVALVPGPHPGTLRVKGHECQGDVRILQENCQCAACREGISRGRLHALLKANNPVAVSLLTQHNLAYMMSLVRNLRQAILDQRLDDFCRNFVQQQFPEDGATPTWVKEALAAAGITGSTGSSS